MATTYRQIVYRKLLNKYDVQLDDRFRASYIDIPVPDAKIVSMQLEYPALTNYSSDMINDFTQPEIRATLSDPKVKVSRFSLPSVYPLPGDKGYYEHIAMRPNAILFDGGTNESKILFPASVEKTFTLARAPKVLAGQMRIWVSATSGLWDVGSEDNFAILRLLVREEIISETDKAVIAWGGYGSVS
jgi:hypothetical protein